MRLFNKKSAGAIPTICAEYDIIFEEAERDVKDFLEDLGSIGAIKPVPSG